MLDALTAQLGAGTHLDDGKIRGAVAALADEQVSAELKAGFLSALADKGETAAEIAAFASELRDRSIQPPLDAETRARKILDVCGTGGDRLNTFNISTTVALVAAAAGVTVAKHGNRAITSQAGSADVLEALGIRIDLTPEEAARSLREHQFAFFFAPMYHPAFRHIGPARKLCAGRGQRTIFNFLGPLLNPARPGAQLVGVAQPALCEPMARVLQALGVRRAMVVCGEVYQVNLPAPATATDPSSVAAHLDEFSTLGGNLVAEFHPERGLATSRYSPGDFPLQPATLADLVGGNREANAAIVRSLLNGADRGPRRDAVLLNAAAALSVAEKTRNFSEGWALAAEVIDSGKASAKLQELAAVR